MKNNNSLKNTDDFLILRLTMLFKRNIKGDMSFQMILVILAVIALIVLVFFLGDFKEILSNFSADVEEAFADCDLDGIENKIDRCPCLSTLGDSEKEPNLIGCPVPTTTLEADNDRKTCTTYEGSAGKYSEECDKKDAKDCTTRCDNVHSKSTVVEDKQPGIETDGDLTVELKKFGDKDASALSKTTDNTYSTNVDLASWGTSPEGIIFDTTNSNDIFLNNPIHIRIPIELSIKNIGSGVIPSGSSVQVWVYDTSKSHYVAKGSTLISEQMAQNQEKSLSFNVEIGNNGDACDGEGERSCYVKIKVDSDEKGVGRFSENDEKNNELFVLVTLTGQKNIETFKVGQIMAVIGDGSDGGLIDDPYCLGDRPSGEPLAVSTDTGGTIPTFDYSFCLNKFKEKWVGTDGSFPEALRSDGNCWVFAVDDDGPSENVGAGPVAQGERIQYGTTGKINLAGYKSLESDADSMKVFEQLWSSTPGGLICKQGWWNLCDSAHQGNVIMVNAQRFVCDKLNWEQRN